MKHQKWTIHRIHKWMGLISAIWLIVLGFTGFLLDHRDSWRWLWQNGVSHTFVPENIVKNTKKAITLLQLRPDNNQWQLAGGKTGLWWTKDSGNTWKETKFIYSAATPMVSAILYDNNNVWIATDNGIWWSGDNGQFAHKVALSNRSVTSLVMGTGQDELMGVTDRSEFFRYQTDTKNLSWITLGSVEEKLLPAEISLSRFVRDIHYGRGIFSVPLSLLWNDITAFAMIILSVTGALFYLLPRRWKVLKQENKAVSLRYKKLAIRWIFRFHAPVLGMVAALPLIYLSVTGIILDHPNELRNWMKTTQIARAWQTPVYNMASWNNEIYAIASYPGNEKKFSLGTRVGLFTTNDSGRTWHRENLFHNKALFVWSLRRHEDYLMLGGMGGPNLAKQDLQSWQVVKGTGHMPTDIAVSEGGQWIWKSHKGIITGNLKQGFVKQEDTLPVSGEVAWFYLIDGLHSGMLITKHWKWVNDVIAVFAIFLVLSGLYRWWNKKWI